MKLLSWFRRRRLYSSDKIVLSFAGLIVAGTLALHLPFCSTGTSKIHLRDCLFTATSAVCVTGLSTIDVGKEMTFTGEFILLMLIQIGGLGILTFSNGLILSMSGNRSNVETRLTLSESIGSLPEIRPANLLKNLFFYTFMIEGCGAILLYTRFVTQMPVSEAIWSAIFHSISAFCNAGFSLFTANLMDYRSDPVVSLTICGLIILGGLGFIVFADMNCWLFRSKSVHRSHHLSYHSKVVIFTTLFLIIFGTLVCLLLESKNTLKDSPIGEKVLASLFLSVTARTAGYNTVNTGQLGNVTLCFLMLLMGIGASPGSTGGGVKTTSFATMVAFVKSRCQGRENTEWLGRTIPRDVVAKSLAVSAAFGLIVLVSLVIMESIESGASASSTSRGLFIEHLFEIVSALGTVGLSTGVTPDLAGSSQILLVFVMYLGRVGPLLLASSIIGSRKSAHYSYPQDHLLVG